MSSLDSLLEQPKPEDFIAFGGSSSRHFMLFVDTEEEFDWLAPFDRNATSVTALGGMARCQAFMAAAGVAPVYMTDYPVVTNRAAADMMGQWLADGTADIGAHLHPWVNPPHQEDVCDRNSYVGNLPMALERAKLETLCAAMETHVGRRPIAYRAGRYGIGPNSGRILADCGFKLDCSIRSRFDYSASYGPDFSDYPLRPYRTGPNKQIVELPLSTAYVGALRRLGNRLGSLSRNSASLTSGLARLGLFYRIPLTPEGVTAQQCISAIDALLDDDVPVLSFSFHSPTTEPGNTFYVRDAGELEEFYRWWDIVLNHLALRSVTPMGLNDFLSLVGTDERACQAA